MTAVLRVLSYNVHRWQDDRAALARVVRGCAPHVVLVQEAPTWFGSRRRRRAMAASFGMRYLVGVARNAVLVADGLDVVEYRGWRVWRPSVRRRLRLAVVQLPGGAVGARVSTAGTAVVVVGCHLGLHGRGRLPELDQVLRGCASFGMSYLLAGDLNEEAGGPVWQRLAEHGLTDLGVDAGPTFPSGSPQRRIDAAMSAPGLSARLVSLSAVPAVTGADLAAASDHLPLLVQVTHAPGAR